MYVSYLYLMMVTLGDDFLRGLTFSKPYFQYHEKHARLTTFCPFISSYRYRNKLSFEDAFLRDLTFSMHIFITTKNHAKHALTYETLLICIHLLILNYRYQPKYLNYLRIVKKYTSFFSSPPMLHPPNGRNNSRRKSRRKKSRTTTMPTN